MARAKSDTRSARAWALAGRQHGVVARGQLLGLGFSEEAIEHRLAKGKLHPAGRGVYAVGWPRLDRKRRWMAAVLACGEGAALSHRSAAALWEIGVEWQDEIEISVPRRCEHRREGIRARSRPSLPVEEIAQRDGIPVTALARTLLDLATVLDPRPLERAVSPDRRCCRPGSTPNQSMGQRLRSRLLLARSRLGRGDGRSALPPHRLQPNPRPSPRSSPHRGRADHPPFHALAGEARARTCPRGAGKDRTTSVQASWSTFPVLHAGKSSQRVRHHDSIAVDAMMPPCAPRSPSIPMSRRS